jgi:hypothetical protein
MPVAAKKSTKKGEGGKKKGKKGKVEAEKGN